jgi:hypothetical protein
LWYAHRILVSNSFAPWCTARLSVTATQRWVWGHLYSGVQDGFLIIHSSPLAHALVAFQCVQCNRSTNGEPLADVDGAGLDGAVPTGDIR